MTVIFTTSDFWIETVTVPITLPVGAGSTFIVMTLEKGGRFVGGSVSILTGPNGTASQAVGIIRLADTVGGTLNVNDAIPLTFGCYVNKVASAGSDVVTLIATMFMRK